MQLETESIVMRTALALAQQGPIVVDVSKPQTPAPDISVETVLGIFAMTGALLAFAALGSAIVAVAIVIYKRRRDRLSDDVGPTHTQLGL